MSKENWALSQTSPNNRVAFIFAAGLCCLMVGCTSRSVCTWSFIQLGTLQCTKWQPRMKELMENTVASCCTRTLPFLIQTLVWFQRSVRMHTQEPKQQNIPCVQEASLSRRQNSWRWKTNRKKNPKSSCSSSQISKPTHNAPQQSREISWQYCACFTLLVKDTGRAKVSFYITNE